MAMDNLREKLIKLLCEASSLSVDAELFEDSSYAQQLEMEADFLIANGVTVQRWIPVSEQLPEENEVVLARLPHPIRRLNAPYYEDVLLLWRVKHNRIDGHSYAWERAYGAETVSYNPTHWMRLPEPPKEVEP